MIVIHLRQLISSNLIILRIHKIHRPFLIFVKNTFFENTVFLNDITKEDQRKEVNYGVNKFNLYNEVIYGFNFFGHFNIHDQDDMWWEKYVKLRIGFQITEQNSIILYATSLPMEQ